MNIQIYSEYVPAFTTAEANQTWRIPGHRGYGNPIEEVPAPWDEPAQKTWFNLFKALAEHKVADVNQKNGPVPYKYHSGVGTILAAVPGWGMIRDRSFISGADTLWKIPNYSRDNFLKAIDRSIYAATANFPNNKVNIGFFSVNDGGSPALDEVIVDYMATHFPQVGGFMENLMGSTPGYSPTLPQAMLFERSKLAMRPTNWYQACGIWSSGGICEFTPGDNDIRKGIRHAADRLYGDVIEIYQGDIIAFGSKLQEVHDYIRNKYKEPVCICSSFTYSDWEQCAAGSKTRKITSSGPDGCVGGNAILSENCKFTTAIVPGDVVVIKRGDSSTQNVRNRQNGVIIGRQPDGARGTVEEGPVRSGPHIWVKVNFESGVDGWVTAYYIVKK